MSTVTLEKVQAEQARLAELIAQLTTGAAKPEQQPRTVSIPPRTIDLQPGEHYAGLLLDEEGTPLHHLVLLAPAPEERMTWQAAKSWAASVGGELPTRREQSLLFANAKQHFAEAWYWSNEAHEDDGAFAWGQGFYDGGQNDGHTSYEGRVRAVRRLAA